MHSMSGQSLNELKFVIRVYMFHDTLHLHLQRWSEIGNLQLHEFIIAGDDLGVLGHGLAPQVTPLDAAAHDMLEGQQQAEQREDGRQKILAGIQKDCQKRPVSAAAIEGATSPSVIRFTLAPTSRNSRIRSWWRSRSRTIRVHGVMA